MAFLTMALLLAAGCSSTPRPAPGPTIEPPAKSELDSSGARVSETARAMLGVPYRYGGSSPSGFDCSGLVYYAYVKAGIVVPRTAAEQHRQSQSIAPRQLKPGDLVFFDTSWRNGHVGIYIGGGEFIHAPSSGKRVSKASINEGYFSRRLTKAGRFITE